MKICNYYRTEVTTGRSEGVQLYVQPDTNSASRNDGCRRWTPEEIAKWVDIRSRIRTSNRKRLNITANGRTGITITETPINPKSNVLRSPRINSSRAPHHIGHNPPSTPT